MSRKTTFIIKEEIITRVKEAVKEGYSKSMTSFVESALEKKLEELKKQKIQKEIIKASEDPLFLEDIQNIEQDYKNIDFE